MGKYCKSEKFPIGQPKASSFFLNYASFFKKACIIFEKKDAFGAVERLLEKKTLENFSSILPYLKLFRLAIYSRYSSKA
jgi:hypothetical protein